MQVSTPLSEITFIICKRSGSESGCKNLVVMIQIHVRNLSSIYCNSKWLCSSIGILADALGLDRILI